ncbi:MAG: hypothetical protein WA885_08365 [Phormidesmis sp.]
MIDSTVFPLPSAGESAAQIFLRTERDRNPHNPYERCAKEELRHILLGSPEAIRQAIHQLHVLNYAESLLWSPVAAVKNHVIITPDQGAAISLLRRLA